MPSLSGRANCLVPGPRRKFDHPYPWILYKIIGDASLENAMSSWEEEHSMKFMPWSSRTHLETGEKPNIHKLEKTRFPTNVILPAMVLRTVTQTVCVPGPSPSTTCNQERARNHYWRWDGSALSACHLCLLGCKENARWCAVTKFLLLSSWAPSLHGEPTTLHKVLLICSPGFKTISAGFPSGNSSGFGPFFVWKGHALVGLIPSGAWLPRHVHT